MEKDVFTDNLEGRRSEPRSIIEQYHCVEFQISVLGAYYQFKIWDISNSGLCILVKESSAVINNINVGDILNMKYYPTAPSGEIEDIKTKIRHITKSEQGRFKGHYLVGLSILEKQRHDDF